jgi:hypothetical protein
MLLACRLCCIVSSALRQIADVPSGMWPHTVGCCGIVLYNSSSLLYFTSHSYLVIWTGVSSWVWIYCSCVCPCPWRWISCWPDVGSSMGWAEGVVWGGIKIRSCAHHLEVRLTATQASVPWGVSRWLKVMGRIRHGCRPLGSVPWGVSRWL